MKINYDYYSGKDLYSDGSIEDEILEYAKKFKDTDYNLIFKEDIRWPVFYHFTYVRQNILNWYPFKKDSDVLEIGAGMGAITGVLCKKCKKVTSVELSKKRSETLITRCKDYDNLELIIGNFNDIKFKQKFDYITLIGVLEYANLYTDSDNAFEFFLSKIKSLLKPDGKLLIAIENQFGLKYFAGACEDHTNLQYDGICGYENKKGPITYGKNRICKLLDNVGLCYKRFYYPLPDYKLPNVIFSDEFLPDECLIENMYDVYYYEDAVLNFDEKRVYKEIIKEGKFDFFANSFFVECSQRSFDKIIDFAVYNSNNNADTLYSIEKYNNGEYIRKKINVSGKDEEEKIKINSTQNIVSFFDSKKDENQYVKKFFTKSYLNNNELIDNLNLEIQKKQNENQFLKSELEKIYHSRSWKYTGILRKIKNKIKK